MIDLLLMFPRRSRSSGWGRRKTIRISRRLTGREKGEGMAMSETPLALPSPSLVINQRCTLEKIGSEVDI